MEIRESAEMYLETIFVLSKNGKVRSIDIAKTMGFSRPSVSVTIHNLEKEKYVNIESDGSITLAPKGQEIAQRIYERHTVITSMLEQLGVDKETAAADACKIEHDISDITFSCLKKHFGYNG